MYRTLYFIQTNIICIIILFVVLFIFLKKQNANTNSLLFRNICISTIFLCLFKLIAGIFSGQLFFGAKIIIELSNALFLEFSFIVCYFWLRFVCAKIEKVSNKQKNRINLYLLLLMIMTILILLNHWTNFFFHIDDKNLFVENYGIFLYFVISSLYLLIPIIKIINNKNNKLNLVLLSTVMIITNIFQFLFYESTIYQFGITISILIVFLHYQNEQITKDELTQLNNRFELNRYLNEIINIKKKEDKITIFMIDANRFKQINDKFGHVIGDKALIEISQAIKNVCKSQKNNLFVSRYGGDEFLIVGTNLENDKIVQFNNDLNKELALINQESDNPYELSVSIGTVTMNKSDIKSIEELIYMADANMYEKKQKNR